MNKEDREFAEGYIYFVQNYWQTLTPHSMHSFVMEECQKAQEELDNNFSFSDVYDHFEKLKYELVIKMRKELSSIEGIGRVRAQLLSSYFWMYFPMLYYHPKNPVPIGTKLPHVTVKNLRSYLHSWWPPISEEEAFSLSRKFAQLHTALNSVRSKEMGQYKIRIKKNRHGKVGAAQLIFDQCNLSFKK
jgi:hypothetical protein